MSGTLGDHRSDATLVAAAVAGDRHALAGIYDRYADRMHDYCWSLLRSRDEAADAMQDTFVLAADRLHQLRDPERLRPWLYAVARSVALGRLRARQRERAEATLDDAPDTGDGPHESAHRRELRDLVWQAAQGLSERDQVVLTLHLRHGLEGRELATALDVTENNANVTLSRVRDRVERSLGAFLVARLGSEHCPELQEMLRNWDGRFTPLVRKRVARHVDGCDACDERRRAVASPWALLGTVPLVPAPDHLRPLVLGRARLASARRTSGSRGRGVGAKVAAVAVAALVAAGGVVAVAKAVRGRSAGATAAAPAMQGVPPTDAATVLPVTGGMELAPQVVRLAAGASGALRLHNAGATAVTWTADVSAPWLVLAPARGTVPPGGVDRIAVSTRRPPDGAAATVTVTGGAQTVTATVEVRGGAAPGGGGTDVDPVAPGGTRAPDPVDPDPTRPREPDAATGAGRVDPRPSDPARPAGGAGDGSTDPTGSGDPGGRGDPDDPAGGSQDPPRDPAGREPDPPRDPAGREPDPVDPMPDPVPLPPELAPDQRTAPVDPEPDPVP